MHSPLCPLVVVGFVACAAGHPPAPAWKPQGPTAILEGEIVWAVEPRAPVSFGTVVIQPRGLPRGKTTADEQGRFRIEVPAGVVQLGDEESVREVVAPAGQVTRADVAVGLTYPGSYLTLPTCPGAPLYTEIEGHPAPQREVDAIARATLAQLDGGLVGDVLVARELSDGRALTDAARPAGTKERFYVVDTDLIATLATRRRERLPYARFARVDSDGRCALVEIRDGDGMAPEGEGNVVFPRVQLMLLERRGDAWQLVRVVAAWET